MHVRGVTFEDFVNYKKPAMFIISPYCDFKCDKENGTIYDIDEDLLVDKYMHNPIVESVVIGGLEPFLTFDETCLFISKLREKTEDDIVIYTGYTKGEIMNEIYVLSSFKNIVVKYGRYIPGKEKHYDEVLGVYLASGNQYAERIS